MAVDNSAWDGSAAMSRASESDDPAAAYEAICAGRKDGDPALQSSWALPHHANPGDAPNADGTRNALSRLPQTDGLTNAEAAQRHLEAHMEAIRAAEGTSASLDDLKTLDIDGLIELDATKRVLGVRIVPYNTVADSRYGPLMFEPGAFGKVDPTQVRLRMDHEDPPTGLGRTFEDRPDAPYMEFKVSKTSRGDDQLALARDGVSTGASVGFADVPDKPKRRLIDGRRVTVYGPGSAQLAEVSTTWQPTFSGAGVQYVLARDEKGAGQMAETQEAPAVGATVDTGVIVEAIKSGFAESHSADRIEEALDKMNGVIEQFHELSRAQFSLPKAEVRKPKVRDWVEMTLKRMGGQQIRVDELKALALDDVVTDDNPGAVPDVFTSDYDDVISQSRPFLSSTRQVVAPATGQTMTLPLITTRAAAGTQYGGEKTEVTTTATKVGTGTFNYQTVIGGSDISIQMILRADRSFFDLLNGDMAEALALDEEIKAIAALLAGYTDSAGNSHTPDNGGAMDPETPAFGQAWQTSILKSRRAPTHIWMSAAAVGAFIDAQNPLTNAPLYSNLAASFTAAGGPGGTLSGLTPVYVPALDTSAVDVIVGPSRGFVWAEDPARRLEADNPSVAGRDIALVGGLFPAPRFADAFTTYTIAS